MNGQLSEGADRVGLLVIAQDDDEVRSLLTCLLAGWQHAS